MQGTEVMSLPGRLDRTTGCSWLYPGNTAGTDMGTGHRQHSVQQQPSNSISSVGATL